MATSEKKKGKTKWRKVVDPSSFITPITSSNWADESNDPNDGFDFGRKTEVTLPTAPRAARGAENDAKVPLEPPFQAYLSNVSYEVTEEDLVEFFSALKVKSVRLPRDDRGSSSRAKGFGYVEFEDRNSLIEALSMPDTNCKNRRMRIDVAEGDQGRGGRGGNRDRGPNEPDRTMGDWRSGPRIETDSSSDRDGYRSGPKSNYMNDRNGMYGDRDRRGGGSFRDDDRDRGGFRDRPGFRDNRGGFRDDRGFRDGGGDRYDRRGYDDRRGFDDRRPEYSGGGGGGGDNKGTWRRDPDPRDRDQGPPIDRNEPKTRTKLNLQPRSRPVEERVNGNETPVASQVSTPPATAASIFGGARPVDTAAREREIEERLAKQREDRPASRDENKPAVSQPRVSSARDPPDPPSSPPLEPAPPPKENVWTRRQQTSPQMEALQGEAMYEAPVSGI